MKIGVDWGGTKIEAIAIDPYSGSETNRLRVDSPKDNYEEIIDKVVWLVNEITKGIPNFTVGIGMPGSIHPETNLVQVSNTKALENKPVKMDIENQLGYDIKIANDADCLALSEAIDGSGANYNSVWGVIIGSGFGGSFVHNKKVVEGVNQVAGDWGHQPLPYPRKEEWDLNLKCPVDNCGRPLCAEQFISGIGFTNIFNRKYKTNFTTKEIVDLELNGDERAKKEFDLYEDRFARLIAVMIGIVDPDVIILGGGMSNIE